MTGHGWSMCSARPASASPRWSNASSTGSRRPRRRRLRTSGVAWPNGQGITYAPLGDILRSHLGFEADAGPDRILAGLAGREILGLTLGLDTGHGRNPRDARDLLHAAWLSLVDEIVAIGPAVFVVEDLHWAPPPLLELMADLVTGVAGPLLVVATARPEYAEAHPAPVGTPNQQQALWLDPLTDEQSEAMLRLPQPWLPNDLTNRPQWWDGCAEARRGPRLDRQEAPRRHRQGPCR